MQEHYSEGMFFNIKNNVLEFPNLQVTFRFRANSMNI